jgi:DNA-binding beta-propeller fold protein YncE
VLGEPEKESGILKPYGMALFDGKLYVCDVGKRIVEVFDIRNRTFRSLTEDKRLTNPINICITEDGTKYVSDPSAGAVFVFDRNNNIDAILGKELNIAPIDVAVRGRRCYVTDFNTNQVVVIDIVTNREILRLGSKSSARSIPMREVPPGQFVLISDLALDREGNIYVTDKAAGRITKFDSSGIMLGTIGQWGSNIDEFIRPKGLAIDKENRIWVVDAAPEVAKIYDEQGRLLLFFGLPGNAPGNMNLPTKVILDYDNVELFRQYAVEGADIEFLVLVSNQYGSNKINVYGFGNFPSQNGVREPADFIMQKQSEKKPEPVVENFPVLSRTEAESTNSRQTGRKETTADLYYRSLAYYRSGQFEKARDGFIEVMKDDAIPPAMVETIREYLADINSHLATDKQKTQNAELYYRSMSLYRAGRLEEAREGFLKVLNSGLIPPEMAKTIDDYLRDINNTLRNR